MIMTQHTKFYTNNNGQFDKVDILTSYRKIGVVPSIMKQVNQGGNDRQTNINNNCKNIIKIIIFLGIVIAGIVFVKNYINKEGINVGNIDNIGNIGEQFEFKEYDQNQQLSISNYKQYLMNNQRPVSIKQYINNGSDMYSHVKFEQQLIKNMICEWKNNKILCQIKIEGEVQGDNQNQQL